MLSETQLTERLDERGMLADAQGPGCYALELRSYDWGASHIQEQFRRNCTDNPVSPATGVCRRIANAQRLAYVGQSHNVYQRLCQHVNGKIKQTAIMQLFPPRRVIDVWPCDNPDEKEFQAAVDLARDNPNAVVWSDGKLY